jgi:RNA polymerase sigma factor (sigma-70 family)
LGEIDYQRLFLEQLPLVDQVTRFIARRHRLSATELEELMSVVRLKLVERDYEVLRKFSGRSSLQTYLVTVVERLFLDERRARWGTWRPSAQARRLGPAAILIDRLVTRDRFTFEQALETARTNHGMSISPQEADAIELHLPRRMPRRLVSEDDALAVTASVDLEPDQVLAAGDQSIGDRVEEALAAALDSLDPDDRLLLKLRFVNDMQVSAIARLLSLEQRPLYRRLERAYAALRRELETRGLGRDVILELVGQPTTELTDVLSARDGENTRSRPSDPQRPLDRRLARGQEVPDV